MSSQFQQKIPILHIPHLKEQDIVTSYAQMRPFREGGPRVQENLYLGKRVIHNYGHGGAGVSLAPATSHQAVTIAANFISPGSQVGVIGSGVMGLLTACMLKQKFKDVKVKIYAQQIPQFGDKDNKDLITSQIAPGYWLPYEYGLKDQKRHNEWSVFAFQWYKKLSLVEKFKSVIRQVEVYSLTDTGVYQEENKVTENLKHTSKMVDVCLDGKITARAHVLKTLKIDMQPFLDLIVEELKSKQVSFVAKKITSQNFQNLTQSLIFNCAGLGSRQLFGDTKMRGLKGHIIEYKNPFPEKYNYFLKVSLQGKNLAYYMHGSRILVGNVMKQKDQSRVVSQTVVKEIKDSHGKVLERYGLKPIEARL